MSIKTNNHIVEDFFTNEEVATIKELLYTYYEATPKTKVDLEKIKTHGYPENAIMIQDWSGRSSFNITKMLPDTVLDKLKSYVRSHGEKISWYSFNFVRYSNEFGTPFLGPHLDEHDTNFTIDYQLQSNTEWGISVEDKEYILSDNSAVIFSPSEQVHWRNPKKFLDGEYVDMILFYFTTESDSEKMTLEQKRQVSEKYQEEYNKKAERL